MKKIKYLIISLIIFAFNINVFAASGSLKVSSSSVYIGDSFKVTANVNSAAAWNVHVSASGPVSGCVINQANVTDDAMDTNKAFSATCVATGKGTITIRLSGDVTSASGDNSSISGSRSVIVSKRPNRSKNSNIKELSVDGYELVKVDNNNYTLLVPNDVTSINIKAIADDSKSKVTGSGSHNINIGENNIEVVVTAENGSKNKITIKVTRKDGYYLEDLDSILNNNEIYDKNITLKYDTKITAQDMEKIKNSNKIVKFNYYNDDKNLIYSWIVDGTKIKDTNDLLTTISDSDNKKDILRLSNYADGLFVRFKQVSSIPAGVKIKLFVGDKYEDNDLVNLYIYKKNNDKLELVKNRIKVESGYIEFDITDVSDYFVTMSTIQNSNEALTSNSKKISIILPMLIIIIALIVIAIIIAFILKNKKNNKNDESKNNQNMPSSTVPNSMDIDTTNFNSSNSSSNYNSYNASNINTNEVYNKQNEDNSNLFN